VIREGRSAAVWAGAIRTAGAVRTSVLLRIHARVLIVASPKTPRRRGIPLIRLLRHRGCMRSRAGVSSRRANHPAVRLNGLLNIQRGDER